VCFDGTLTARIWYPFNHHGEIDPHWETWPTRRNYPVSAPKGRIQGSMSSSQPLILPFPHPPSLSSPRPDHPH
jgi:hypothetical protein